MLRYSVGNKQSALVKTGHFQDNVSLNVGPQNPYKKKQGDVQGMITRVDFDQHAFVEQFNEMTREEILPEKETNGGDGIPPPPSMSSKTKPAITKFPSQKKLKLSTSDNYLFNLNSSETSPWVDVPNNTLDEQKHPVSNTNILNEKEAETKIDLKNHNAEISKKTERLAKKVDEELEERASGGIVFNVIEDKNAYTDFHGETELDYLGRPWWFSRDHLSDENWESKILVPRKRLATLRGHKKGVNCIRWMNNTIALSSSLDGTLKAWNLQEKSCLRSYFSIPANLVKSKVATNPVKFFDMDLLRTGGTLCSTSMDGEVQLFDIESGGVLQEFKFQNLEVHGQSSRKVIANQCKFLSPNEILMPTSNHLVVHVDLRASDVVQEYMKHQSQVLTVCALPSQSRFVSGSEDGKIVVWDVRNTVYTHELSGPGAKPVVNLLASRKKSSFFYAQSASGKIGKFEVQASGSTKKKKIFSGHQVGGYNCEFDLSRDEKYLATGDSAGKLVFYNEDEGKAIKQIKAHRNPCVAVCWNQSVDDSFNGKILTGGWDHNINIWGR
eukprot:augustus_masked-scaffold_8-processed-gene-1.1-mRNA-1 protein AED:0.99 eAED:1.00 QI:0/-1/0/1/-1/1/1/0/553